MTGLAGLADQNRLLIELLICLAAWGLCHFDPIELRHLEERRKLAIRVRGGKRLLGPCITGRAG